MSYYERNKIGMTIERIALQITTRHREDYDLEKSSYFTQGFLNAGRVCFLEECMNIIGAPDEELSLHIQILASEGQGEALSCRFVSFTQNECCQFQVQIWAQGIIQWEVNGSYVPLIRKSLPSVVPRNFCCAMANHTVQGAKGIS